MSDAAGHDRMATRTPAAPSTRRPTASRLSASRGWVMGTAVAFVVSTLCGHAHGQRTPGDPPAMAGEGSGPHETGRDATVPGDDAASPSTDSIHPDEDAANPDEDAANPDEDAANPDRVAPSARDDAPLGDGPVIDLDEPEPTAPSRGGVIIDRDQEAWETQDEDVASGAEADPRGWAYPVIGVHLDVTAPLSSTQIFTPSAGAELEAEVGMTPFLHLGGFFRIGYGGLSTSVLGSDVDDASPERIAILIGPRARLVSPVLWGAVTAFFDFTFAYQYLTVAVDDNEPEDCTIDVFGFEECSGGPTVLDRASRDGQTIGLGGGLAFETHAMGEGSNWADGSSSLKLVLRANYLINDWLSYELRNRSADQMQIALGALFW